MLGDVSDARVLDLYCGTGALGIEALSRGAGSAVFVDSERSAVALAEANLDLTAGERGRVVREDALVFLGRSGALYDLVFADPPYDSASRLGERLSERLPAVLAPGGRIVTESDKRNPLELSLPLVRERTYGDTRIAIHG